MGRNVNARLLFNADSQRVGDDLTLVDRDGNTFFVSNCFLGEKRRPLLSPEGAALTVFWGLRKAKISVSTISSMT